MKSKSIFAIIYFILSNAGLIWFIISTDKIEKLESMTLIFFVATTLGLLFSFIDTRKMKR